ncbi:MAG: immunoglobulin domain-containing protein [Verrucomicrobia bacterium]|nr:immunoglobulin domain-containing protein [Verrucomicrobiota bacterium]
MATPLWRKSESAKPAGGADEGFTIEIGNIPYEVYDVYVYYGGSTSTTPRPILANGTERWAWKQGYDFNGQWSVSEAASQAEAVQGSNVLLWRNRMGPDLVLSIPQRNGEAIVGFQIVELPTEPSAPVITQQPQDILSFESATIQFTVLAQGSPPVFTYQWRKNGVPLTDGLQVNGAQTQTLTLSNLSENDAAEYDVIITNSEGSITSRAASLTIDELIAPTIVGNPQSALVSDGSPLTLSVSVIGSTPFTFQWRRNGNPISNGNGIAGANTAVLSINAFGLQHEGNYDVVVSNAGGQVTSTVATVTLFVPPSAETVLAEWNFNNFTATSDSNGFGESIHADAGTGILYVQSATSVGTNLRRNTSGGTSVNASNGTPAGGSLELRRGERWNNGIIEFRIDMTGYENAVLTFAYRTFNTSPSSTLWNGAKMAALPTFRCKPWTAPATPIFPSWPSTWQIFRN